MVRRLRGRVTNRFCRTRAFFDPHEHVCWNICDRLLQSTWPPYFEGVNSLVGAKPEKDARVLRRAITHAASRLIVALEITRDEFQVRADSIAIAFRADELDGEPVIVFRRR